MEKKFRMATIMEHVNKHGKISLANFFNTWSILFFVIFETMNSIILSLKLLGFHQASLFDLINILGLLFIIIFLFIMIFAEPFKPKGNYCKTLLIPIIVILTGFILFTHPTSLVQFSSIIRTITGHNPGEFIGHGNHCGFSGGFNGGQNETVDLLDKCCQEHDTCWNDAAVNMSIPYIVYLAPYKFTVNNKTDIECSSNQGFTQLCLCDVTAAKCFKRNLDVAETFRDFNGTIYYDKTKYDIDFNFLISVIIVSMFVIYYGVLNNTIIFIIVILIPIPIIAVAIYFNYKKHKKDAKRFLYILNNFFPFLIVALTIKLLRLWKHGNFNLIIIILVFFNLLILILNFIMNLCLLCWRCCCRKQYQPIIVNGKQERKQKNKKIYRIKKFILIMSLISCVLNFIILSILNIMINWIIYLIFLFILFFFIILLSLCCIKQHKQQSNQLKKHRNIIIRGLPWADKEEVSHILNNVLNTKAKVISIRLPKRNEIIVTLASISDRTAVLKNARKLKDHAKYGNVYINPDETIAERARSKALRLERKRLNGADSLYNQQHNNNQRYNRNNNQNFLQHNLYIQQQHQEQYNQQHNNNQRYNRNNNQH